MTRVRVHESDSPFGAWIRSRPDLDSVAQSIVVTDVDFLIQRYRVEIDAQGSRDMNYLMHVEIKTRSAMPSPSQHETLWIQHQCVASKRKRLDLRGRRRDVWHFGVFVLSMPGERPDDGPYVEWCSFLMDGQFRRTKLKPDTLAKVLRFDLRPDNPRQPFARARRHHKTRNIVVEERTPLGFAVDRELTFRS